MPGLIQTFVTLIAYLLRSTLQDLSQFAPFPAGNQEIDEILGSSISTGGCKGLSNVVYLWIAISYPRFFHAFSEANIQFP
jgi:hypothetical protein